MKTLVFISIAFALALFTTSISAQDSKVSFGIQLKPTITWLGGLPVAGDKRLSYSAGLISEYEINSQFAIKSGISLERKGTLSTITFTDTSGIPSGPVDIKYNFDYLVVPVIVSYSTKGNGNVKTYFDGGPYIGYLLSHKIIQDSYGTIPEITTDNSDNTRKIDLGLSLGTGLCVPLGNSFVFDIGLNANLGLINARKDNNNSAHPLKPNSVGLLMALKYRL